MVLDGQLDSTYAYSFIVTAPLFPIFLPMPVDKTYQPCFS
jgi:hypothetical protein